MIHTSAGNLWRQRLRRPDGTLPLRTQSLEAERAFWRSRAGTGAPDPYARRVFQRLMELAEPLSPRSVLEIGPGWGNYTLPLCETFSQVTCVDVSPDNLRLLSRRTGGAITSICAPWEEAQAPRSDLIFGYNCLYRLEEPEVFLTKMDALADRLCVLGMNRPPELPWLPALEQAGLSLHYTRQGCEELLTVLRSLQIPARLEELPNVRRCRYPNREALLRRAEGFLLEEVPRDQLWELLEPFHRVEADGSLLCEYPFTSQLLVWEPLVHRPLPAAGSQ